MVGSCHALWFRFYPPSVPSLPLNEQGNPDANRGAPGSHGACTKTCSACGQYGHISKCFIRRDLVSLNSLPLKGAIAFVQSIASILQEPRAARRTGHLRRPTPSRARPARAARMSARWAPLRLNTATQPSQLWPRRPRARRALLRSQETTTSFSVATWSLQPIIAPGLCLAQVR